MPSHATLPGEIIKTTQDAVLVEMQPNGEEIWIPRSCCEDGWSLEEGDDDPQVATCWLRKEGLD